MRNWQLCVRYKVMGEWIIEVRMEQASEEYKFRSINLIFWSEQLLHLFALVWVNSVAILIVSFLFLLQMYKSY